MINRYICIGLFLVASVGNCYAVEPQGHFGKDSYLNKSWYNNIVSFCMGIKQKMDNDVASKVLHHGLLIAGFVWYVSWYRTQLVNRHSTQAGLCCNHMGYWLNFVLSKQMQ